MAISVVANCSVGSTECGPKGQGARREILGFRSNLVSNNQRNAHMLRGSADTLCHRGDAKRTLSEFATDSVGRGKFRIVVGDPCRCVLERHRARQAKALNMLASQLRQHRMFP